MPNVHSRFSVSFDDFFSEAVALQQGSPNELVVWSPLAGQIVICCWVLTLSGVPLKDSGLREYLRSRKQVIPCFCPMKDGVMVSSRIVHPELGGHITAYCHHYPPVCGFELDITRIAQRSSNYDKYLHIPTHASQVKLKPEDRIDIPTKLNAKLQAFGLLPARDGCIPVFEGYLGEHAPLLEQLAQHEVAAAAANARRIQRNSDAYLPCALRLGSTSQTHVVTAPPTLNHLTSGMTVTPTMSISAPVPAKRKANDDAPMPASKKKSTSGGGAKPVDKGKGKIYEVIEISDGEAPVAGPSSTKAVGLWSCPSDAEQRLLRRIAKGKGLSYAEVELLFIECPGCLVTFIASYYYTMHVPCRDKPF